MTVQSAAFLECNLGKIWDAKKDPQQTAFIGLNEENEARIYSYAELDRRADAFAWTLKANDVRPGERIALIAENSVPYLIALLGIVRLGAVAVPINFRFPAERIAQVLADCGAKRVLVDAARAALLPAGLTVWRLEEERFQILAPQGGPARPFPTYVPQPTDPALMLYTSGSTGRPKGVLLSHRSQLWVAQTRCAAHDLAYEVLLIAAPLCHMNALALVFYVLAAHATAVLLPKFQAQNYLHAITRYQCTWLTAVPPMIAMLLREKEALAEANLHSVRVVRMGSAPVSPALRFKIHELLPNAQIVNAYGTTESSPIAFGAHPQGLPIP